MSVGVGVGVHTAEAFISELEELEAALAGLVLEMASKRVMLLEYKLYCYLRRSELQ